MSLLLGVSRLIGTGEISPLMAMVSVRNASKKASGSSRNRRQAKGPRWSVKTPEGSHVYSNDIIVTQGRLRYLPGMNVLCLGKLILRASKEGKVIFTSEQANMNYENSWVKQFYGETEGTPVFKKYAHVIPTEQHKRFKLVDQV